MRAVLVLAVLLIGCGRQRKQPLAKPTPPDKIILWVWDRADDLRFLKPGEAEVAALMRTLYLRNGGVEHWHRKLPLHLPDGISLIPVTRFESDGSALPTQQAVAEHFFYEKIRSVGPIQIDFDVRASQITWYRDFLGQTKEWKSTVSITSVVSGCLDNPALADLTQEIVPMLFRMGPQRNIYLAKLQKQGGFAEGCRSALGISTDEPLPWRPSARRVYVFNPNRWTRESFDQVRAQLR